MRVGVAVAVGEGVAVGVRVAVAVTEAVGVAVEMLSTLILPNINEAIATSDTRPTATKAAPSRRSTCSPAILI